MKYGKVKREHGRVQGLDDLCNLIVKTIPSVTRIVPGRIKRRRGTGPAKLTLSYATDSGLKYIYSVGGTVQELFVVTGDAETTQAAMRDLIKEQRLA